MQIKKHRTREENEALLKERKKIVPDTSSMVEPRKRERIQRFAPINDILKYYRVVRFYTMKKYQISHFDLEFLFFFYSEQLFSRKELMKVSSVYGFNDEKFKGLYKDGWFIKWREHVGSRQAALYELSHKAKMMIADFYKHLDGTLPIPTNEDGCCIFNKAAIKSEKLLADHIVLMNSKNKAKVQEQDLVEKSTLKFRRKS